MKTILYLFLLISLNIYAQSRDEVIARVVKAYTIAKPLQYNMFYNLYKDDKSTSLEESYKGFFSKNAENDVYLKVDNTEFIYNSNVTAKIIHNEKIIQLYNSEGNIEAELDINNIISNFENGYFKEHKTYWEVEFTSKIFSSLPYRRVILFIGKDYFLQKQIFFYSTAVNFSTEFNNPDFHYPRLEIIYEKHIRSQAPLSLYDTSKYFTLEKNKVALSSKFSNYTIFDNRKNKL